MKQFQVSLTGRELAILGAVLSRCRGFDRSSELQRFVNVAAEFVRNGFDDAEMDAVQDTLADAYQQQRNIGTIDAPPQ